MDKILVTGGLGFIGSHTVVELQNEGFEVVIIDNLSNSSIEVLDGITAITGKKPIFEELDLRDKPKVQDFFKLHSDLKGVIHFAASKAVGESVENPLLYYENNINTLVYVLQELKKLNHSNFIFSSSCTVYGQADTLPITEDAPVKMAESPYGNTKQIGEEIVKDLCAVTPNFKGISLRYFNPIGAHSTVNIGELPIGIPQNLVPFITQTAIGIREQLSVFGNDYPTSDGTCVRDYVHINDLATAHLLALEKLESHKSIKLNLGTGRRYSVQQVIEACRQITGHEVPTEIGSRRAGDPPELVADASRAKELLAWQPEYTTIESIVETAWQWHRAHPNGFGL